MYVGRIVVIGRTGGSCWVGYRVSSRSFPNRLATLRGGAVMVSPRDPRDLEKNPYIAYNCIRLVGDAAVVANGTQADMIAEKIEDGMKPMDAIALSLVAYGYERDELDTPRIAGVVRENEGWLGIAQKDEVRVKRFLLEDGEDCAFLVATYGKTEFEPVEMFGADANEVSKAAFNLDLELPVCSASAFWNGEEFSLGAYNPE